MKAQILFAALTLASSFVLAQSTQTGGVQPANPNPLNGSAANPSLPSDTMRDSVNSNPTTNPANQRWNTNSSPTSNNMPNTNTLPGSNTTTPGAPINPNPTSP